MSRTNVITIIADAWAFLLGARCSKLTPTHYTYVRTFVCMYLLLQCRVFLILYKLCFMYITCVCMCGTCMYIPA